MDSEVCQTMTWESSTSVMKCASGIVNSGLSNGSQYLTTNISSFVVPLVLVIMTWTLWKKYTVAKDPNCSLPLPPGSMGLPIVGETINLIMKGSDFFRERSKSYGNVYKTHILGSRTIRVTGAHNVEKILKGEGTIVASQWPPSTKLILGEGALAHSKGETHRWRREIIMKAFSPQALQTYIPSIQSIVHDHVTKWCEQGHVHGYPEARSLTFTIAAKLLLGFDINERKKYQMLILFEDMLATLFSMPIPIPGIGLYRGLKARKKIMAEISDCIKSRQDNKQTQKAEDALALILQGCKDGEKELTPREIQDSALEMLFAGHLPTSSAACSVLMLLGSNPKVVDKITVELYDAGLLDNSRSDDLDLATLQNLSYIDCVIREILRVAPPVGAGYRKALETFEVDGCQVPKGWTVVYSIRETQQTAEHSSDGDKFNPDRWRDPLRKETQTVASSKQEKDFNYVPFGHGQRACVGQKYAEVVLKVLIVELVRNATWRLVNGVPQMMYMPVPHPNDNLPLQFRACPPDMRRRAFTNNW